MQHTITSEQGNAVQSLHVDIEICNIQSREQNSETENCDIQPREQNSGTENCDIQPREQNSGTENCDIQPREKNSDTQLQVDVEYTDSGHGKTGNNDLEHMHDDEEQQIQAIDNITKNNFGSEIESGSQGNNSERVKHKSKRLCCIMFLKVTLIAIRYIFRFLIVPLLQLQLFSDYAWYCLLNNVIRNYCETVTNRYFIGLDHSLVIYCVYILLLISLLFSFLISWFPKGIPQVVLLIEPRGIMINTKGKSRSQFKM